MDEEFVKSVLGKAQDQYDRSLRWTAIVVIILLVFHVLIFSPFLKADKRLSKVEAHLNSLSGMESTVAGLAEGLTGLSDAAMEAVSQQLKRTFRALRADFDDLSKLVERIRTGGGIRLSEEKEQPGIEQPSETAAMERLIAELRLQRNMRESNIPNLSARERPNLQMQRAPEGALPQIKVVPPEQRFGFNQNLVDHIKNADNIDGLTDILLPTINEKIIAPQFEALNKAWRTDILPEMKRRAEEIQQRLKVAEQTDPAQESPWRSIRTTLESTLEAANNITFAPPADRFWWITVEGKGEELAKIDISVRQELDRTLSITGVTDDLAKTIAEQKSAEMKLKNELDRIKKSFDKFIERQAEQLAGLPQQIGSIPVDLVSLVSRFPLLIGLVLAALTVWQTRRQEQFIIAVGILREQDRSSPLATWLMRSIDRKDRGRRMPLRSSLGFCVASWFWIGIASWELAGWRAVGSAEATILFLVSGAVTTAGFVYRSKVLESELTAIK